jgi:mono/diheme cytochrome c family protein
MIAARSTRRIAALALSLGVLACSRHPAQAPATPAPTELPGYEVRLGRDVYEHYCQTCHGDTGAGDGFNAFNLDPHPRDLSAPDFQKKKTDADLRDAIRRGGAGVGLSPLMPPWGRTLSARQMDDVILYLRTLKHSGS